MDQQEIKRWIETLAFVEFHQGKSIIRPCRNNAERKIVIAHLLRHADDDEMTDDDRVICRRAILALDTPMAQIGKP